MRKSTHTPEYDQLRKLLRKTRKTAKLSQRALAKRLDITYSYISKVETGERRIDLIEFFWFISACKRSAAQVVAEFLRSLPPFSEADHAGQPHKTTKPSKTRKKIKSSKR